MLNERTEKVLCSIVKSYIQKPEPVGSRFVTKRFQFNLSPATIRVTVRCGAECGVK